MKTATVRDLRNRFPRVAAWIHNGEPVEITKSGKPFARLVPATPEKPRRFKMPDIMARLRANFGDKVYSAEEVQGMIEESRGERS
jgi:prevent-host-death family protein